MDIIDFFIRSNEFCLVFAMFNLPLFNSVKAFAASKQEKN